jgi:hypothetical protein
VLAEKEQKQEQKSSPVDVSALSSMLASRWKGSGGASAAANTETSAKRELIKAGQIRRFRITKIDPGKKKIELDLID